MTRTARRLGVLLSAVAAATSLSLLTATAAHAYESAAESTTKSFNLPNKPDVTITIRLGVWGPVDGRLRHQALVTWDGTLNYVGGKRFHHFIIDVRSEKYVNGADKIWGRVQCDITDGLNSLEHGEAHCPYFSTYDSAVTTSRTWSTDGDVSYDIADDGNGTFGWGLAGTPRISNAN